MISTENQKLLKRFISVKPVVPLVEKLELREDSIMKLSKMVSKDPEMVYTCSDRNTRLQDLSKMTLTASRSPILETTGSVFRKHF